MLFSLSILFTFQMQFSLRDLRQDVFRISVFDQDMYSSNGEWVVILSSRPIFVANTRQTEWTNTARDRSTRYFFSTFSRIAVEHNEVIHSFIMWKCGRDDNRISNEPSVFEVVQDIRVCTLSFSIVSVIFLHFLDFLGRTEVSIAGLLKEGKGPWQKRE